MQLIIEKDLKYHGTLIRYWKTFDDYSIEKYTYECPKEIIQDINTENA